MTTQAERLQNMRISLMGLAVGDAFGDRFFVNPSVVEQLVAERALPKIPWDVTDDTVMACGIAECLLEHGQVLEDELATIFARNYQTDMNRGYGGTAHSILRNIGQGVPWQEASSTPFEGSGSMGNGGAMRAAPLGAYFFDQPKRVVDEARKSAAVTHWHPEGQAGAIAIALAAAWATSMRMNNANELSLFEYVLHHMPDSELKTKINKASVLPLTYDVRTAVSALGNGHRVLSLDTVPFTLWCAARCQDNYEEAMWLTVSGLGDRDTTCAIVGGILAALHGIDAIPLEWRQSIEQLGELFAWSKIMGQI